MASGVVVLAGDSRGVADVLGVVWAPMSASLALGARAIAASAVEHFPSAPGRPLAGPPPGSELLPVTGDPGPPTAGHRTNA